MYLQLVSRMQLQLIVLNSVCARRYICIIQLFCKKEYTDRGNRLSVIRANVNLHSIQENRAGARLQWDSNFFAQ